MSATTGDATTMPAAHAGGAMSRLPASGEQVDGAEGQERHVQDRAEQVEELERPLAPPDGGAEPEAERAQGEHEERDGPHQLVASASGQEALEREHGERGGEQGRGGSQGGVHRRSA
jgi:hypothetical protein